MGAIRERTLASTVCPPNHTKAEVVPSGAYQFRLMEAVVSPGCKVRLSTSQVPAVGAALCTTLSAKAMEPAPKAGTMEAVITKLTVPANSRFFQLLFIQFLLVF